MKAIANILAVLAFVATAHAEDMNKGNAASMENKTTEPAAEAPAPAQAAPAPAPAVSGTVARAAITSGVENHEPVDNLTNVTTDTAKIYYFTELRGMEGQTVTHRWEHNGEVMAEVPFQIGGPRWRVFSSKNLTPAWTGEWKVSVVDANGGTLSVNTFTYKQAPESTGTSDATPKDMTAGNTETPKSEMPGNQ